MMNLRVLIILAIVTLAQGSDQPTEPVACTAENEGRCQCGDNSQGFFTYTFWQEGVQRCFTVFFPLNRVGQRLPVLFSPQCYSTDKLTGFSMTDNTTATNKAAARYGYARIGVSTPDKNWRFGRDTVINDDYPMPCSDEDSKDMAYIRKIFNFLEASPVVDMTRVYTKGFSQNSMWAAYIGYCFPNNVKGIYQAGSGLALTEQPFAMPGCEGKVRFSDLSNPDVCPFTDKGKYDCKGCMAKVPCDDCKYFPIYPCYSSKRPMVHCVVEYDNDGISNKKRGGISYSTGKNMYNALVNEGHDARLYRFSPDKPELTIKGSHSDVKNADFWQVGCMGITDPCSSECENEFIACVESLNGDNPTALERTENFASCIDPEMYFSGLSGCTNECAPTLAMMSASETPTEAANSNYSNWGAGVDSAEAQPETSICKIE